MLQGYRCITFADDGTKIDIVYPSYYMKGKGAPSPASCCDII